MSLTYFTMQMIIIKVLISEIEKTFLPQGDDTLNEERDRPYRGFDLVSEGSVRPENGFQRMPNGCRTDRKYAKNTCPLISVPKSRLESGEDHRGRFQERVNRTRTAFVTDKERLTNGQNGQGTFN